MEDLWILGFVVLVLATSYLYGRHSSQQRTQKLREIALKLNMTFLPLDPELEKEELRFLPLFFKSSRGFEDATDSDPAEWDVRPRDILRGNVDEREIIIFNYTYTTGSHKSSTTHYHTVAAFRVDLPIFTLKPEKMLQKIGAALGMQDIDFDNYPAFSSAYQLSAEDESVVRRIFAAPILRYFSANKDWRVEAGGGWLIVYKKYFLDTLVDYSKFRDDASEIATLFDQNRSRSHRRPERRLSEVAKSKDAPVWLTAGLISMLCLAGAGFCAWLAYLGSTEAKGKPDAMWIVGGALLFMCLCLWRAGYEISRILRDQK